MSETQWFYINAQKEKVGPISAEEIKQAYARGQMRLDSLIWAQHLPQWQALSDHVASFGINLKPVETTKLASGEQVKYANFIHRWAAHLFDVWLLNLTTLLIIGGGVLVGYLAMGYRFDEKMEEIFAVAAVIAMFGYFLVYPVLSGVYHTLLEGSLKQGSWGKQLLGLVVVTDKGEPVDRTKAFTRWAASFISHMTQSIGFIIAAFTPRRQALHDYIAAALVVESAAERYAKIERNTRAIWVLAVCIVVMPTLLVLAFVLPMVGFIKAEEAKKAREYSEVVQAIAPVKSLVEAQFIKDGTCLIDTDAPVVAVIGPLKAKTTEIIMGEQEDEVGCEIYVDYGTSRYVWYRIDEQGAWFEETEQSLANDTYSE